MRPLILLLLACGPGPVPPQLETGDTCDLTAMELVYEYNERVCEWNRVCGLQNGRSEEETQSEYEDCVATPPTNECYEPCGDTVGACLDGWDYTLPCRDTDEFFAGIPNACKELEHCD